MMEKYKLFEIICTQYLNQLLITKLHSCKKYDNFFNINFFFKELYYIPI